jgi:hypothetical protein
MEVKYRWKKMVWRIATVLRSASNAGSRPSNATRKQRMARQGDCPLHTFYDVLDAGMVGKDLEDVFRGSSLFHRGMSGGPRSAPARPCMRLSREGVAVENDTASV